jgi:hypothetical protein
LPPMNRRKRCHRFLPATPLSMALPNGLAHRGPLGLLAPILCHNPMAPYAAQRAIRFPCMSADRSVMARYVWSTVLALRIAVPVLFEHNVRNLLRRANHGKSALFFGPLKPPHRFWLNPLPPLLMLLSSARVPLLLSLLLLSFGETGLVVSFVVGGFVCCARKPSS